MTKNNKYWDEFYSSKNIPSLPSQFAIFVANEYVPNAVVEFGCGNGRDSLFFARRGYPVIGIDGSIEAVENCKQITLDDYLHRPLFICSDISDPKLYDEIAINIEKYPNNILLYSRFFLHAINEVAQTDLLILAAKILSQKGGCLALEFRTPEDRDRQKFTDEHYRRFVDLEEVIKEASCFQLVPTYTVKGLGMAKYKSDDAYVARILFKYSE